MMNRRTVEEFEIATFDDRIECNLPPELLHALTTSSVKLYEAAYEELVAQDPNKAYDLLRQVIIAAYSNPDTLSHAHINDIEVYDGEPPQTPEDRDNLATMARTIIERALPPRSEQPPTEISIGEPIDPEFARLMGEGVTRLALYDFTIMPDNLAF